MGGIQRILGTNLVKHKKFTLEIMEYGSFVEYAVVDQDDKRNKDFEKAIWFHLEELLGKIYGVKEFEIPEVYKD
jgi:RNase P/RNase MRP subunit POP5|tara:strand:+ start:114 stop:335 length:222 start_codon:yes stop_codon:yes gene_type:complete